MSKIALIAGSPNPASRLTGLLQYVTRLFNEQGHNVVSIQVSELPAEALIGARFDDPDIAAAVKLVEDADAVVIGSPVYKASYSGVLKTFLDLLPQKGLAGKPVLPLFIGGTISHLLAIDYALKPLLSALGATHQLGGVYAVDSQVSRAGDGAFELDADLRGRLRDAAAELSSALRFSVSEVVS